MKKLFLLAACLYTTFAYAATPAIHYDPLDGALLPSGMNAFMFHSIHGSANQSYTNGKLTRNSDFEQNIMLLRYSRWQTLGIPFYFGIIVPTGDIAVETPVGRARAAGLGDITVVVSPTIIQWGGGYMNIDMEAVPPTGEYSRSSFANMGDNRWNGKFAFNAGQDIGKIHLDYWLGYDIYSKNSDVDNRMGGKTTLKKDSDIFTELHITYFIIPEHMIRASLSVGGIWGGEETLNGEKSDKMNDYATQFTLSSGISENVSLSAHYKYDLKKYNGPKGYETQLKFMVIF